MLNDVLMSNAVYDMNVGYGQGINDIVSVLMNITTDEADLFWLLQCVMSIVKCFYCSNSKFIQTLLNRLDPIVSIVQPKLATYIKEHDISYIFAFKWVVLLFKRYISDGEILRVWDVCYLEMNLLK